VCLDVVVLAGVCRRSYLSGMASKRMFGGVTWELLNVEVDSDKRRSGAESLAGGPGQYLYVSARIPLWYTLLMTSRVFDTSPSHIIAWIEVITTEALTAKRSLVTALTAKELDCERDGLRKSWIEVLRVDGAMR
jgi:hypothetical protein